MANGDHRTPWSRIRATLTAGDTVRNCTQHGGYLGDDFTIQAVQAHAVVVETPGATNLQQVPREDFAAVWAHWDDYCRGECPRNRLRDMTRFSKYVISILHHVQQADEPAADSHRSI